MMAEHRVSSGPRILADISTLGVIVEFGRPSRRPAGPFPRQFWPKVPPCRPQVRLSELEVIDKPKKPKEPVLEFREGNLQSVPKAKKR
jgi:hypothetical protein